MSEWGNPQGAIPVPHAKGCVGRTRGTETSKYPQEEKITMIPQVVASERGRAQTEAVSQDAVFGVIGSAPSCREVVAEPAGKSGQRG